MAKRRICHEGSGAGLPLAGCSLKNRGSHCAGNCIFLRWAPCLLVLSLSIAACRSSGITVQIVNHTQTPIRSIELLYPGGSYGIAHLDRGSSHSKWIKPNADAALHLSFVDAAGQKHVIEKIMVRRGYTGGLAIVLLPEDKIK